MRKAGTRWHPSQLGFRSQGGDFCPHLGSPYGREMAQRCQHPTTQPVLLNDSQSKAPP